MKPLQSIAMGMVVIALIAPVGGGFDLLANPLGWVLVLLGVRALPADLPWRSALLGVAALAGLVSLPLWVPDVVEALDDADEALAWAVNLPQFGCYALLSFVLAGAAAAAGRASGRDLVAHPVRRRPGRGRAARPGLRRRPRGLTDTAGVAVAVVPLAMIVLLFVHAGRAWAGADAPDMQGPPAGSPGGGR